MHGRNGCAGVYVSLAIFRDDRCMFRAHPFDRALFITDLFRAIAGIVLTAMAAPLIVSLILLGPLYAYSVAAPIVVTASFVVGLSISWTAALINAAVLSVLARFRVDALPVSLFSGALIGLWARTMVGHGKIGAPETWNALVPFGATGALMGALYWLIAIWPQKRRRLANESVSTRSLDRAAQDTFQRKRDRRIPWDGRVPPD
jgi:hypothetical protein